MRLTLVAILAVTSAVVGRANTYRVEKTGDTGYRTLRWAIGKANTNPGPDTIKFAPALAGKAIRPATALPDITGAGTVINGDINADGAPDVAINGKLLATGYGLKISADDCAVTGLAVTNFPFSGVAIFGGSGCSIRRCHLGVNLAGTKLVTNGLAQVLLFMANRNVIGGPSPAHRNIIGGPAVNERGAVRIVDSDRNVVCGNYFGLTRDGMAVLHMPVSGEMDFGVQIEADTADSKYNVIGGNGPGRRNVFAGLGVGVVLEGASYGKVQGNWFGLAADGDTELLSLIYCAALMEGAHHNTVGGTSAGVRNVFAGADTGVYLHGAGTQTNWVQGNLFGSNAAGTQQRTLDRGVNLEGNAGANTIGGGSAAAGNYFTPVWVGSPGWAVRVGYAGGGSKIRNNTFGRLHNGQAAGGTEAAIFVGGVRVTITDNDIRNAEWGLWTYGAGALPSVYRNQFRNCDIGVRITGDARCSLGNLGNASTGDDGGNVFRSSTDYHISNRTADRVRAEGNNFGTTSKAEIDAKIYDRKDNSSLGRVDFDPLAGGVHPSDAGGLLALTGLSALPTTGGGAEIVFSVAAEATVSVEVLNIAGRPIAQVARDLPASRGLNRVLWSGMTSTGTRAPAGRYLVRVSARDAGEEPSSGQQASGLCMLLLR